MYLEGCNLSHCACSIEYFIRYRTPVRLDRSLSATYVTYAFTHQSISSDFVVSLHDTIIKHLGIFSLSLSVWFGVGVYTSPSSPRVDHGRMTSNSMAQVSGVTSPRFTLPKPSPNWKNAAVPNRSSSPAPTWKNGKVVNTPASSSGFSLRSISNKFSKSKKTPQTPPKSDTSNVESSDSVGAHKRSATAGQLPAQQLTTTTSNSTSMPRTTANVNGKRNNKWLQRWEKNATQGSVGNGMRPAKANTAPRPQPSYGTSKFSIKSAPKPSVSSTQTNGDLSTSCVRCFMWCSSATGFGTYLESISSREFKVTGTINAHERTYFMQYKISQDTRFIKMLRGSARH